MAWTEITRAQYDRRGQRYASDCTDEEWALIEPFTTRSSAVGRPRVWSMREIWNAIAYIGTTGCHWAQLPKDFPPFTAVQHHFYRMSRSGLLDLINEVLVGFSRMVSGRAEEPTAGIIGSQSVKTTESGGPRGNDAGKKIEGRKRHLVTDADGNLLAQACGSYPSLARIIADGGYVGSKFQRAVEAFDGTAIEIVRRPGSISGFIVIARCWVVERTLAGLGRCCHLAQDWEESIASADAWPLIAAIRRTSRFVARKLAHEL